VIGGGKMIEKVPVVGAKIKEVEVALANKRIRVPILDIEFPSPTEIKAKVVEKMPLTELRRR